MTVRTSLQQLYDLSPKGVTLGLDRVVRAADALGNPQAHLYSVQIAGTNGKGSVCALLAHGLEAAGLRVGLFTSPHLHRFSERIRINGREISPGNLERYLHRVLALNRTQPELSLSFFEIATLAALIAFKEAAVDVCVLETGLGGRLDAVSAAAPQLTAVTSVGLDHTGLLGDTVEQIAAEKAGIARKGVPLLAGTLCPEALAVLETACEQVGAPLLLPSRDYPNLEGISVSIPWPGRHQIGNVALAAALFRNVAKKFPTLSSRFSDDVFFRSVPTTVWPGRFEIIEQERRFILDCAHNMEAATALVDALRDRKERPAVLVYGALKDKPATEMLNRYRPSVRSAVLMPPPIARALDPKYLAAPGDTVVADAAAALSATERLCSPKETVLVTGSIFTVAAIRAALLNEPSDPPVGL